MWQSPTLAPTPAPTTMPTKGPSQQPSNVPSSKIISSHISSLSVLNGKARTKSQGCCCNIPRLYLYAVDSIELDCAYPL